MNEINNLTGCEIDANSFSDFEYIFGLLNYLEPDFLVVNDNYRSVKYRKKNRTIKDFLATILRFKQNNYLPNFIFIKMQNIYNITSLVDYKYISSNKVVINKYISSIQYGVRNFILQYSNGNYLKTINSIMDVENNINVLLNDSKINFYVSFGTKDFKEYSSVKNKVNKFEDNVKNNISVRYSIKIHLKDLSKILKDMEFIDKINMVELHIKSDELINKNPQKLASDFKNLILTLEKKGVRLILKWSKVNPKIYMQLYKIIKNNSYDELDYLFESINNFE